MQALINLLQSPLYKSLNSIIIYARARYVVEIIANFLGSLGIGARCFHAGMTEIE